MLAPGQAYLFTNNAPAGYSGSVRATRPTRPVFTDFGGGATSLSGIRMLNGTDRNSPVMAGRLAQQSVP